MNYQNGIQKCSKNLLLRQVVNGSIITKLSLQAFMIAYENIDWQMLRKWKNLLYLMKDTSLLGFCQTRICR